MRFFVFLLNIFFLNALSGCGYTLQGTSNPLQNLGIHKIYISSFKNETYRPGIEQFFTTAMIREIEKGKTFQVVNSEKEADAILIGQISAANSGIASTTSITTITTKAIQVATEYVAQLSCGITLKDPSGKTIFSQNFSGSKNYTGSSLSGDAGATVPLTNDSEERMAYQYISTQMMSGAYQRMIDLF